MPSRNGDRSEIREHTHVGASEDITHVYVKFHGIAVGDPGPAAIGVTVSEMDSNPMQVHRDGEPREIARRIEKSTRNQAMYEALVQGLLKARRIGSEHRSVTAFGDSELIAKQILDDASCDSESIRPFYEEARWLASEFHEFEFTLENDSRAKKLARSTMEDALEEIEW